MILKAEYELETGNTWTNSQGKPDIGYVEWLEKKVTPKVIIIPIYDKKQNP
jgi:hypothetical protein